jgi:hypothetical protein
MAMDPVGTEHVPAPPVAAVVTHHRDGFRSGVARFNELLADALGVPVFGLDELAAAAERPLLSFKARELDDQSEQALVAWLDGRERAYELFLHDFAGGELERRLVAGAARVHCGNDEIETAVRGLARCVTAVWTPGLIRDDRVFPAVDLSIFSFGMAHKVQTHLFRRLRALLDATGRSYALYVSAANHETASLRDSVVIFDELHEIFPDELYFLGNLSDVAVANYLRETTYYAAFFPSGVRANNTSVASALERGAVVITNLDQYSPAEYVHLENVIDIEHTDRLPVESGELAAISAAAAESARTRTWARLADCLRFPSEADG